jgi:2-methylcitrate dehydratase PrpD
MTLAEQLADFVIAHDARRCGPDRLARAGLHVLDSVAVGLAGSSAASSRPVLAVTLATAGRAEASVFGAGRLTSAHDAALANGTLAHALELDDDHRTGTIHPGAVVVPAALAACEAVEAPGVALLRGVLLGYEVMARVGEAFVGRQYARGFHPTGTCGVFGAAVAAGVAFGLDRDALVRALGIAGTQASGLTEWRADGSWIKRLHPGRAAQSGVLAARLAAAGFTGPATILEGPGGFLQAFAHEGALDADALTRDLGRDFRAMVTAFKPYPCCRFSHGAIDLALDLVAEGLRADQVDAVRVGIFRTDILTYTHRPSTPVDAQFCLPYLIAAALVHGRVGLDQFAAGAIRDAATLALADRVDVREDARLTAQYPQRYPTDLAIVTRSGETITRFTDCPRGDPEAPAYAKDPGLLEREVRDKVRALLAETGYGDRAEPLFRACASLGEAHDVRALTELLG